MTEDGLSEVCDNCGDSLEAEVWHPCETERDDEEALDIYTFCDEECREDWSG